MNNMNSKVSTRLQQQNRGGKSAEQRVKRLPAVERAAIEIQREEHEFKADPKDVLKALFMWKDDPEERVSD